LQYNEVNRLFDPVTLLIEKFLEKMIYIYKYFRFIAEIYHTGICAASRMTRIKKAP